MAKLIVSSYTTQITSLTDAKEENYTTTVTATPEQWEQLASKLANLFGAEQNTTITLHMSNGAISVAKENDFFAPGDPAYIFEDTDPSGDWTFVLDEESADDLASEIYEVVIWPFRGDR